MTLENILSEIQTKGQHDVSKIIEEAKVEAGKILSEAKEKLRNIETVKTKETNDKIKQLKIQELSIAELDAKKNILNMQKDMLERLRAQVLEKLKDLPADKNQHYLTTLINRARTEFTSGKIYCNARDEAFVKKNAPFKFAGTRDCIGGILVESDDGSINMDFTYENILDEAWKDATRDISKVLFKND